MVFKMPARFLGVCLLVGALLTGCTSNSTRQVAERFVQSYMTFNVDDLQKFVLDTEFLWAFKVIELGVERMFENVEGSPKTFVSQLLFTGQYEIKDEGIAHVIYGKDEKISRTRVRVYNVVVFTRIGSDIHYKLHIKDGKVIKVTAVQ